MANDLSQLSKFGIKMSLHLTVSSHILIKKVSPNIYNDSGKMGP